MNGSIDSISAILTAYFLIVVPIMFFFAYGKRSTARKARTEKKTMDLVKKAQKHLQKFRQKEGNMIKAEDFEKQEIIKTQGFADQVGDCIKQEENFLKQVKAWLRNYNEQKEIPHISGLIDLYNREIKLLEKIKDSLKNVLDISHRLVKSENREVKDLAHDIHKALIMEEEGKFEHALSKEEKDYLSSQFYLLNSSESTFFKLETDEKKIKHLANETIGQIDELIKKNKASLQILQTNINSNDSAIGESQKELKIARGKRRELDIIQMNLHILHTFIEKSEKEELKS